MAGRLLLGAAHTHAAAAAAPDPSSSSSSSSSSSPLPPSRPSPSSTPNTTLDLRIAAVFVILAAGLLGSLLPVLLLKRPRRGLAASLDSAPARVLQAFAGATIAALAVVHVAPVAVELLGSLPLAAAPFDHLGGAVVLVGLFLSASADGLLAARAAPEAYKRALRASLLLELPEGDGGGKGAAAAGEAGEAGKEGVVVEAYADAERGPPTEKAAGADPQQQQQHEVAKPQSPHAAQQQQHHHHHHVCSRSLAEQRLLAALAAAGGAGGGGDDSTTTNANNANANATNANNANANANTNTNTTNLAAPLQQRDERRAAALAYSLEAGCVFHSVLIGLAVGVSVTASRPAVAALAAAVAVHQGVEGVALGCALARAPFSRARASWMAVAYSLTTPLGVAAGIGLAAGALYDPDSLAAVAATGVANGLSAGLLLYLGLCSLMMEELSKEDLLVRPGLRWAVHGAVLLGGAVMCVLALWA